MFNTSNKKYKFKTLHFDRTDTHTQKNFPILLVNEFTDIEYNKVSACFWSILLRHSSQHNHISFHHPARKACSVLSGALQWFQHNNFIFLSWKKHVRTMCRQIILSLQTVEEHITKSVCKIHYWVKVNWLLWTCSKTKTMHKELLSTLWQ